MNKSKDYAAILRSLFITFSAVPLISIGQITQENARIQSDTSSPSIEPQAVGAITGQGTAGKIVKFTGANSVGNSIITESNSKIGIGIATPSSKLTVQTNATVPGILANNTGTGAGVRGESTGGFGVIGKSSRTGVQGISTGSVGNGVWGDCSADTGVLGSTSTGTGVYGNASSSSAHGT